MMLSVNTPTAVDRSRYLATCSAGCAALGYLEDMSHG